MIRLFYLLMISLVTACVSVPENNVINFSDNVTFSLMPPSLEMINTTSSHLIEISYLNDKHRFIAQVEYASDEIVLAAISAEGVPLFDFIWRNGGVINMNQYVPLPNIDIGYVIADMQLCHWALAQIKKSLKGQHVEIKQIPLDRPGLWKRSVYDQGKLMIEVVKTTNGYSLKNMIKNYHISLTDLHKESV